jgi:hypothetical protein
MTDIENKLKIFKSFIATATDEQKETMLLELFYTVFNSEDTDIRSLRDAVEIAEEMKEDGDERELFEIVQENLKPYCTHSGESLC